MLWAFYGKVIATICDIFNAHARAGPYLMFDKTIKSFRGIVRLLQENSASGSLSLVKRNEFLIDSTYW